MNNVLRDIVRRLRRDEYMRLRARLAEARVTELEATIARLEREYPARVQQIKAQ